LVVIDLQKAVLGFPYAQPIDEVVSNADRLVAAFRERGLPVVFTEVGGPAPTFAPRVDFTFTAPATQPKPDAMDLIIEPLEGERVVTKRVWGSFTTTDLDAYLRGLEVTQIVLTGVATGFGVESTARQAVELEYNVTLVVDAMSDMDGDVHRNSVERIFPRLGVCATTDAVVEALVQHGLRQASAG
jgi:nicotinamidase-related amidase